MKGEVLWMKVAGKLFAMTNVQALTMEGSIVQPFHFINLKCVPGRAAELRGKYSSIRPAWHQNKKHWNTIFMNELPPNRLVLDLIDHSYDLVVDSLTKAQKRTLEL